jgi:CDP-diacylglycerol--glycerol-3-phosphate 3-phosphatidyltransferase
LYSIGIEAVNENDMSTIGHSEPDRAFALHILTPPNVVTFIRPLLTVAFVGYVYDLHQTPERTCSHLFILYGLICASDLLDGWLARQLGRTSPFGRLLDHLCDITFILSALLVYVNQGRVPWWLPASIAWAFIMYLAASWWHPSGKRGRILIPTRIGHWGGILYYLTVGIVTVDTCLSHDITRLLIRYGWLQAMALLAFVSGLERLFALSLTPTRASD